MSKLSTRTSLLRPSAVNRTLQKVRARGTSAPTAGQGKQLVSLLRGEPDFATPAHIVQAAQKALAQGLTHYPNNQGLPELRRAIAQAKSCDPEAEVLVTDGATLGMYVALATVCEPGDGVLVPDFVYDCYVSQIHAIGAQPVPIRSARVGDRFVLTRDAGEAAIRSATAQPKTLLINTPWNPVGTVLRRDELAELVELACAHDLFIISDEIYEAITYGAAQHVSIASLGDDARARTVTLNSFSKTYAMTGWRLGYAIAPPEVAKAMLLVLQQCSRGPATFVQHAGLAALEGPQDCVEAMRREYVARREILAHSRIARAEFLLPEGGFFALLDIAGTGRTSEEVADYLLNECGVVTMPGSAYGAPGEGFLRVSFATSPDTIRSGLSLIADGLARF